MIWMHNREHRQTDDEKWSKGDSLSGEGRFCYLE